MTTYTAEDVGYDVSPSAHDPQVLCADCGEPADGAALHAGDEWGGMPPRCRECGYELPLTLVE